MTRFTRAALAIAILTLVGAGTATLADDSISRTFPFRAGERLELDTEAGHVEIRTGSSGDITVTVEVERGVVADYIDVDFQEMSGGLRVIGEKVNRRRSGDRDRSGSDWKSWFSGGSRDSNEIRFIIEGPEQMDLDVSTGGGHIELDTIDGDVSIKTSGGHISFERVYGTFEARTSGGHIKGGTLEEGGLARTSGGHINIDGAGNDLEVETSGGHISVGDVNGDLDAQTSGGHISTDMVEGNLTASTSGGHVEAHGCGGDADVSTAGGRVILEEMQGFVRAHTAGGHMRVQLADGNNSGADLSSDDGGIVVQIPRGAGFDIDAVASGAYVEIDARDARLKGQGSRDRFKGTIGRGGGMLKLRSDGYDIVIEEK